MSTAQIEKAPAKINLTLHVVGRRPDGYHEIESLVAFAAVGDTLKFTPDNRLSLAVLGPGAPACGDISENLVLKAARALAQRIEGLKLGLFLLSKRLPVAAGLGGGSSDAAAALRLLARANGLAPGDARVWEAAKATGADVPVCLDTKARVMRGIGEVLFPPLAIPAIPAVLINPGCTLATKDVFASFDHASSSRNSAPSIAGAENLLAVAAERGSFLSAMASERNDLETAAVQLQPAIARVLELLHSQQGCAVARMSGSGATCFGLFASRASARAAARSLREAYPAWWVRTTAIA